MFFAFFSQRMKIIPAIDMPGSSITGKGKICKEKEKHIFSQGSV
jgi:hypothetical protein